MIRDEKNRTIMLGTVFILVALLAGIALDTPTVRAEPRNLTVKVITPADLADIWLGISGGGYELIAEKGKPYSFEVFVKNGMTNRSMTNLEISQKGFPFEITSITPKSAEMIKPMEIVRFFVNATIPQDTKEGKYAFTFDVKSDQFPKGIFTYQDSLTVVDRINWLLYGGMAVLCAAIIGLVVWRNIALSRK